MFGGYIPNYYEQDIKKYGGKELTEELFKTHFRPFENDCILVNDSYILDDYKTKWKGPTKSLDEDFKLNPIDVEEKKLIPNTDIYLGGIYNKDLEDITNSNIFNIFEFLLLIPSIPNTINLINTFYIKYRTLNDELLAINKFKYNMKYTPVLDAFIYSNNYDLFLNYIFQNNNDMINNKILIQMYNYSSCYYNFYNVIETSKNGVRIDVIFNRKFDVVKKKF